MEVLGAPSMTGSAGQGGRPPRPPGLGRLAAPVPVHPGRDDLRRVGRDPAQHHRHPRPRPAPPDERPPPARGQGRRDHRRGRHRHRRRRRPPLPGGRRPGRAQRPARQRLAATRDELAEAHGDRVLVPALRRHRGDPGPSADRGRRRPLRPHRRADQQRRPGRHRLRPGHDRRAVAPGPRRHAHRHVPLHPGRAAPDGRPGPRGSGGQQRLGPGLARPARPGPLRRGQGRRDGLHPLRRPRRRPRTASGSTPSPPAWPSTPSWPR